MEAKHVISFTSPAIYGRDIVRGPRTFLSFAIFLVYTAVDESIEMAQGVGREDWRVGQQ